MRFIISRVWPSREARGELQRFTVHHPGASKVPWYGISQSERIVRWLFSSPPRFQTVLSVRAALAKRDDELNKGVGLTASEMPLFRPTLKLPYDATTTSVNSR